MWVTSGMTKIDVAIPALFGAVFLIATGTLSWEDVRGEKAAWDIFIWYGGLVRLGKALNDTGVTTAFAKWVASAFSDTSWVTLFAVALLVYFYAHYAFASITAHILAMYPAFLAVLAAKGAPLGLVAYAFACFTNLAAGLTHYGTTPNVLRTRPQLSSNVDVMTYGLACWSRSTASAADRPPDPRARPVDSSTALGFCAPTFPSMRAMYCSVVSTIC